MLAVGWGLACGGIGATEAQVDHDAAAAIAATVTGGVLPAGLASDPEKRPVIVYLAGRSPDPRVVAAALRALAASETSPGDLVDLVLRRLDHPDGLVLAAALELAGELASESPPPALLERLRELTIAHDEPGGRHAALVTLCRYRSWPEHAELVDVVVGAGSDPAPPVVAEALQRLAWAAEDLASTHDALRTSLARLDHPLPGVRANAAVLAARVAPRDGWVIASVRALLDDPHPHVRSAVALALAEAGDADAGAVEAGHVEAGQAEARRTQARDVAAGRPPFTSSRLASGRSNPRAARSNP